MGTLPFNERDSNRRLAPAGLTYVSVADLRRLTDLCGDRIVALQPVLLNHSVASSPYLNGKKRFFLLFLLAGADRGVGSPFIAVSVFLERFLDGGANDLLQVATTVIVISAAFFWISPGVAALSLLPIPFILWGSFKFQATIAPRYAVVRDRSALVNAQLANNLSGIETVKSTET